MKAFILPFVGLAFLTCGIPSWAQNEMVFRPYDPDAPAARVGGAVRGADGSLSVIVLAPGQLAVTAQPSPTLYWYVSAPVKDPVELVLIEEGGEEALVEVILEPPLEAGIHSFEIPNDRSLAVGTTYQWSVAVVPDPDSRSNDVFSSTLMTRIEQPPIAGSDESLERALAEARAGIWYDAIASLSKAVDHANSTRARQLRARLLEQVGLDEVAEFERRQMP